MEKHVRTKEDIAEYEKYIKSILNDKQLDEIIEENNSEKSAIVIEK